ncbi:MAG: SDR family NAD(P)-dependent oxidoreductase [Acidimicrobiales bacterium]
MKVDWAATTAVVTGASRGIGRAVVQAFTERGVSVGAIARCEEDLVALRGANAGQGRVEVASADVSVRAEVEAAVDSLRDRLGPISVLVNNAGVGLYGPVARLDPDEAECLMRVNYLGTVYSTLAVLPGMLGCRCGSIINVASIAGRIGTPLEAAYSASKFAVVGFTEALMLEAAPFGVKVSVIDPGPVDTGFFAARGHPYQRRYPRPVPPEQVAAAVIAALEHPRVETTVPVALRFAVRLRHLMPRVFLSATRRAFRTELAGLGADRGRPGNRPLDPAGGRP